MTKTEKEKKVDKTTQKLRSLKQKLENRLQKTEEAFFEAKNLSAQLEHLKSNK